MNIPASLKPFEYKHSVGVLYLLGKQGKMNISDLARGIGVIHRTGINTSIELLQEFGIVTVEEAVPNIKYVTLTDKGQRIAECLDLIITSIGHEN
jgi:DNA-binding HxlR family transcriptional regulator